MKISDLSKGTPITLIAIFQNKKIEFETKISFINENLLLIPPIKHNNKTVGFNSKFMIDLHYMEGGKLYRFPDVKISLVRYGHTLFHKIIVENEGKVYNRRGDYRLYIGRDMDIQLEFPAKKEKIKNTTIMLKDISLSGFAFICKEELEVQTAVKLKFVDEEDQFSIELPANILRASKNEHLNSIVYGCKITESFPALGQYLIEKQREILRKTRAGEVIHH